jgi:glutathione synthase/RimK-type ligase-like ATP-grasp enzyme
MTMILLISNKDDITTDFVVQKLNEFGLNFYRFNTEDLIHSVNITIDFENEIFQIYDLTLKKTIDLKQIKSVYYRRPEIPIITNRLNQSEAKFVRNELIYTLEGIYKLLRKVFWVSPLYSIRESENKIYQISLAKEIGFQIPNSIITNQKSEAFNFFDRNFKDCIIKPIKSGLVGEVDDMKVIFTNPLNVKTDFELVKSCPTYIQSNIHKKADIRVTVVGNDFFPARIHSQDSAKAQVDWRRSDTVLKYSKVELPDDIKEKCKMLMSKLNLQFGAIDFIENENDDFIFLEINPNGQWAWIEQQLKYPISESIVKLLINGITN